MSVTVTIIETFLMLMIVTTTIILVIIMILIIKTTIITVVIIFLNSLFYNINFITRTSKSSIYIHHCEMLTFESPVMSWSPYPAWRSSPLCAVRWFDLLAGR